MAPAGFGGAQVPQLSAREKAGRSPWQIALIAGLVLLSSLLYLAARIFLPSDGSKIVLEAVPESREGLIIEPLDDESLFREDDLVLGFNGRALDEWLAGSFGSGSQFVVLEKGRSLSVTLLRQDRELPVLAPLRSYRLGQELQQRWSLYFFLVYLEAVSIAVFLRRPRMPTAQAFLLVSTAVFSSGLIFFLGLQISDLTRPWLLLLWIWGAVILYGLLTSGLLHFAFIFPQGSLPARHLWLTRILIYGGVWLAYLLAVIPDLRNASGPVEILLGTSRGTAVMTLTYFPLIIAASALRYLRAANEQQRRQMRWILWALVVANVPWLLLTAAPAVLGDASHLASSLTGLLWCAIPTAFAISILREQLFDIDLIIRRTLVYGVLSAILAATYFGIVTVLQSIFTAASGQRSAVAIVISTLAIAALFNPLRQRIQEIIDRRFFRRKYDAAQTLAAFAATARDEVDLDALTAALLNVVVETMQPEHASLWLRPMKVKKTGKE